MASNKEMNLSIVLSTHQAQFAAVAFKGDLEANLAKISGWGYNGVELAIRDPGLVDVGLLEGLLNRYGLSVPAIGTGQVWGEERLSFTNPDPVIRKNTLTRLTHHIELAQRLNAFVVIGLVRGVTPAGQAKAQSLSFLSDALSACLDTATRKEVSLVLEPINRYETDLLNKVEEGLELIDQLDSPNLGLLLDTFHMNIEEPDIEQSILKAGGHIKHFHVADSNRWHPGAGHLDFINIIGALKASGYRGWISGEFMPVPDADTAAEKNIQFLQQLFGA